MYVMLPDPIPENRVWGRHEPNLLLSYPIFLSSISSNTCLFFLFYANDLLRYC